MIKPKGGKYFSKVLLFGEYTLMSGSMALSIPFNKFYGQLMCDRANHPGQSTHYSVEYLTDYLKFLQLNDFENILDLDEFQSDINNGLFFECNIPISYGLGSSGAIVASVFNAYSRDNINYDFNSMKSIFSKMESYYHGKSSGLDPLVSYFNNPIRISKDGTVNTTKVMLNDPSSNGGIFLLDSQTSGETQPLVSWYIEEMKKKEFKSKIENILIPATDKCIGDMLDGRTFTKLYNIKTISEFTFENFRKMIPESLVDIWNLGLETNDFYLKLCGSGGGGMLLGFTSELEVTLSKLSEHNTIAISS